MHQGGEKGLFEKFSLFHAASAVFYDMRDFRRFS